MIDILLKAWLIIQICLAAIGFFSAFFVLRFITKTQKHAFRWSHVKILEAVTFVFFMYFFAEIAWFLDNLYVITEIETAIWCSIETSYLVIMILSVYHIRNETIFNLKNERKLTTKKKCIGRVQKT